MNKNPFKFGTIVDAPYFTNRKEEIDKVKAVLKSDNHLIIISPRRFGKTSLIMKVLKEGKRRFIFLDLQLTTNAEDMAAQILKRAYRVYHFERIKQLIKNFRIIPNVTLNPANNEVEISFRTETEGKLPVEDVFNLLEKLSDKKEKLIVVLDEFQEIKSIGKELDSQLRSIIQHHKNINYVFLGSQESLMKDIFEKKKSPFYHFGYMLKLDKIPEREFVEYISRGLKKRGVDPEETAKEIVEITKLHPYYTQQLAFNVWELLNGEDKVKYPVKEAMNEIIHHHDMDYERLWNKINRTDKKILIGMSLSDSAPLSAEFSRKNFSSATSTVFSGLKRLTGEGLIIKTERGYEIDDPFFKKWIEKRREA